MGQHASALKAMAIGSLWLNSGVGLSSQLDWPTSSGELVMEEFAESTLKDSA